MFTSKDFLQGELKDLEQGVDISVSTATPFLDTLFAAGYVEPAKAPVFSWRETNIGTPKDITGLKEGKLFGDAQTVKRTMVHNNVQFFEDAAEVTDIAEASSPEGITSELANQMVLANARIKMTIEKALIQGAKKDEDEVSGAQTNGILNLGAYTKDAENLDLTKKMINDLAKEMFLSGQTQDKILMCNATIKEKINELYLGQNGQTQIIKPGQNAIGSSVGTILTDYGNLEIVLNTQMPNNALVIFDIKNCRLKRLIPLHSEQEARKGYFTKELFSAAYGLKYLNRTSCGKIINIKVD